MSLSIGGTMEIFMPPKEVMSIQQIRDAYLSNDYNAELLLKHLLIRVAELEEYAGFLVHGAGHHDLVFALWNETCGGAAADKAAADLRSRLTELDKEIIALRGIIANLLGEKP